MSKHSAFGNGKNTRTLQKKIVQEVIISARMVQLQNWAHLEVIWNDFVANCTLASVCARYGWAGIHLPFAWKTTLKM